MATLATVHRQPPPSRRDAELAYVSRTRLSRIAHPGHVLSLPVREEGQEEPLELPAGAVALLLDSLEAMAAGRGVSLVPENAELTTVQAADILSVSRPYLIKLLEAKVLPSRKVGKHRRVLMEDVMDYKTRIDRDREAVLDRLAAEAQEQGMGYTRG